MWMMHQFTGILLAAAFLTGCAGEDVSSLEHAMEDRGAASEAPQSSNTPEPDSDAAWAAGLIEAYAVWEPATPRPVWTPPNAASLCAEARITGDLGPHDQHAYWVRVDPDSAAAFAAFDTMPIGSIIIKEKHQGQEDARTHGTPTALGVMTKREPGYDPDHGDWEYAYIVLDDAGQMAEVSRGQIASCIDCHANRAQSDYLFRGYLPGAPRRETRGLPFSPDGPELDD